MERIQCLLLGVAAALVVLAIAALVRRRRTPPFSAPPRDLNGTGWQHDALLGLAALDEDQRRAMLDIIWALAGLSSPDRGAVVTWLRAWRQGRD